jgi:hypothetical protein
MGDSGNYRDSVKMGNSDTLDYGTDDLDYNRPMIKPEFVGEALCNILPVAAPSLTLPRSVELVNECLLAVEVSSFQVLASSNVNFSLNRSHTSDNLLHHYVCVVRSTNKPWNATSKDMSETATSNDNDEPKISLDNPNDTAVVYDDLYTSDYAGNVGDLLVSSKKPEKSSTAVDGKNEKIIPRNRPIKQHVKDQEGTASAEDEEVSSYPRIVLLTQHVNGRTPEVRLVVSLDRMMTLENVLDAGHMTLDHSTGNSVKMVFDSGDVVLVDFLTSLAQSGRGSEIISTEQESATASKERFLWALLQFHAILCSSLARSQSVRSDGVTSLSPLMIRNIDRNELQFHSAVNEFLKSVPSLWHFLRKRDLFHDKYGSDTKALDPDYDDVEGLAYDLMMGGYMSRVQLFANLNERQYATEILNSLLSRLTTNEEQKISEEQQDVLEQLNDADYERISELLHKQTRNLEAEMCRRLIAWEDEKYSSLTLTGLGSLSPSSIPGTESASLISLLQVLDRLEIELKDMEIWLEDKAKSLKPTFDDCKDIETGNKHADKQTNKQTNKQTRTQTEQQRQQTSKTHTQHTTTTTQK